MADNDIRKLLDYIITNPIAEIEATTEEMNAAAIDPGEQVAANIAHDVQNEQDAAERMRADFGAGLHAAAAGRANNSPLVLDDSVPAQDAMASALIRFLVKPNLASVETTELGDGHYRYAITIDWPAIEGAAQAAGVNLATALA